MWQKSRKKTGIGNPGTVPYLFGNLSFLYLQISLILIIFTSGITACPSECRCQSIDQLVDCSNASLTQLPVGIPEDTRTLILSDNSLKGLTLADVRPFARRLEVLKLANNQLTSLNGGWLRPLKRLRDLDMSSNLVDRIDLLAFNESSKLQTLKLKSNRLSALADGAFWGLTSLKKLVLDDNHLEHIRLNWTFGLASLQELSIKRNSIKNISSGSFGPMKRLQKLLLSENQLRRLEAETFDGLEYLQILRLGNNVLEFVDENIFDRLKSLNTLDLSYNSLSWCIERTQGIFRRMNKLRRLKLNNNQLRLLHSNIFDGLERVKELDLANNPLTTIEPEAFTRLEFLQELNLNSSSLFCDCSILPFVDWLKSSGVRRKFGRSVHCSFPVRLKEKTRRSIVDARSEDFDCGDRRRPVLIDNFEAFDRPLVAIKHKNIAFYCKVATSLPVKFSWIKDNELIDNFDDHPRIVSKTHSAQHSGNSTLFTNILSLSNVEDDDNGRYQCVGSNEFGVVYSHPFRLNVFIPPAFVMVPSNVTAKIDSTVRWNCSASGHPQPQITWNRPGKFHAGTERRLRFDGDLFFIVNVTKEDAGTYTCSAANEAESIVTSVSLKVVQPATFVRTSPDVITAELDTPASLECIAVGLPTPVIQWFRNGTPLVRTQRHFFTHQDQFLLIVDLREEDAGKYSCRANNEYGVQEVEFDLKPIKKRDVVVESNVNILGMLHHNAIYICIVVLVILMTSIAWLTLFVCYHRQRKSKERRRKRGMNVHKMRNFQGDESEQHLNRTLNTHIEDSHYVGQMEMDYHSDSSKDTGIGSNPTNDHYQLSLSTRNNRLLSPQYKFSSLSRPAHYSTQHSFDAALTPLNPSNLSHLSNPRITNSLSRSMHNMSHGRRTSVQPSYSQPGNFRVPPPPLPMLHISDQPEVSNFQTLPTHVRHGQHFGERSQSHPPQQCHSQDIILQQHHLQSTPKKKPNSRTVPVPVSLSQQQTDVEQEKIETEL